jgi:putative tricarboxylic transport membrane protein
MNRKDLVSSLILLGIAGAYYAASSDIQDSTLADAVGPKGLPTVLTVLLVIVAVAIGIRAVISAPASPAVDCKKDAEAHWLRALGILGLAALYIPVASVVGYWPALTLLLIAVPLYEGMKPSWRVLAVAVGGATFFWVLFELVLGVRQPAGMFF